MEGVTRFLSRRGRRSKIRKAQPAPTDIYSVFTPDDQKKYEKDEEKKAKSMLQTLQTRGVTSMTEANAQYALRHISSEADADRATDLLEVLEDSIEGIIREYKPEVKLVGAVNRQAVTCYLDALLFAMFARLDSFEGMLMFDNLKDEPRRRLATLLRLWVNMLRTGKLITTDITKHLQDCLGACGWLDATNCRQQDASEAFTFITGKLELPLLTLKMDIYHRGLEDKEDDHKFVNERLLEVAIPPETGPGGIITLEECLEAYFNNRIEVKRWLHERRNTLQSMRSFDTTTKGPVTHIESVEVSATPESPTSPTAPDSPISPSRPVNRRGRADSIFSERYVEKGEPSEKHSHDDNSSLRTGRSRAMSMRKEVMMPAWQFFSLLPWYTENAPTSDAQVAAHFAQKRPVLGICLKRYSMLPNGTPQRLNTYVDIPLEIALPHFVSDDRMEDDAPLFGNFKLSLQSVVCHRGVSVDSGHYISLVRGEASSATPSVEDGDKEKDEVTEALRWMRFDDLAKERVTQVNIGQALKEESPYLLFYRVEPIGDIPFEDPPSYEEVASTTTTADPSTDALTVPDSTTTLTTITSEMERGPSIDLSLDDPRGRSSTSSNRRMSIVFDESSQNGSLLLPSGPVTPGDEPKLGFLGTSRRGSKTSKKGNKSRPTSQNGESRLSFSMSRLTGRKSRDKLNDADTPSIGTNHGDPEETVTNDAAVKSHIHIQDQDHEHEKKKSKHHDRKRLRSSSRKPEKGLGKLPDRECIVM